MRVNIRKFPFVFVAVFLVAILLRCVLINWTLQYGNNGDLVRYEDWARIAHIQNFAATYTSPTFHSVGFVTPANNEPPGTIYILSAAYELWITAGKVISHLTNTPAGSIVSVNTYLQHAIMKSSPFLTDLGMGLLIYLLVAGKSCKKRGLFAASLLLFNPVIYYNSAIWGQMDSINNFFFILSMFLAYRANIVFSVLAFAASLYVKLSLLPLLPFYLLFLFFLSKKNIKRIFLGITLSVGAIVLATLPISPDPVNWLLVKIPVIAQGELQNIAVAAFNFWWMIFCSPTVGHTNIPNVNQFFLVTTLKTWAYGVFGILSLPFLYLQIKKPRELISVNNAFLMFSVIALLIFLVLPGMHDRYMYPVFPLLAISIGLRRRIGIYLIIYCLLFLFNLSNIVYSWYPIVLDSKSTFYHFFYGDYFGWIISVLTVLVSGWFYLKSFIELRKAREVSPGAVV